QIPSVSVHIRRGDYYNSKETLRVHGILPEEYYRKAVNFITQNSSPSPRFFIFSDDAESAGLIGIPSATIVSGKITTTHFEDFYLMQQCRHSIIANSSFSWWAAWLNDNREKVVIGPQNWFNEGPKDTQDLLPERWIRL